MGKKSQEGGRWESFKKLDFIGILLYTTGLTIALVGLAWGGSPGHAWGSASVLAPLIIGILTLAACFVYEFKVVDPNKALFPWPLFCRFREFSSLLVTGFVAGMVYYPNNGLLPQATLFIFTNDPTEIGIIALPNGMGQIFGAVVIPSMLHITKAPKFWIVLAVFLQTLFVALYSVAIPNNKAAWMAFQFFGQGCWSWIATCSIVNISLHVPLSELGVAMGVLGTFRSFGGSVGNAILQAVLSSSLNDQLAARISSAALAQGFNKQGLASLIPAVIANAQGVPNAFAKVPGVTNALEAAISRALKEAYAFAFQRAFYATIPFGVIAFVVSLFISDAGKYMTNHTAVHLVKDVFGGAAHAKSHEQDDHHES